jgi:erythromycin esterase
VRIPIAPLVVGVSCACALFAVSRVSASNDPTPDQAIRFVYRALQIAIVKGDATTISKFVTPDFYYREPDGRTENRDQFLKDVAQGSPGWNLSSCVIRVDRTAVQSRTATVETMYESFGTYIVSGKSQAFRASARSTDSWILTGGSWKLRSMFYHEALTYVDGKLIQDEREQLPPTAAAIAQLRSQVVVIPSLKLDADPNELSPIGTAIGSARIVGMGEGSHGTSDFFAFKNRLFKYLVEKKGVTVFAMEAYFGAGLYVDRYIKGGRGTPQQAVTSLGFWTWNTPEVVDLVRWMHDYNAKPGSHSTITFAGIDMQDPIGAIGYIVDYVARRDPAHTTQTRAALACAADFIPNLSQPPPTGCTARVGALRDILGRLNDAPDSIVAQEALTNVLQYLDYASAPVAERSTIRDRDMAENLKWLATSAYPRAKIAIWAHNGHVGASSEELGYRTMGTYLRETFKNDYYVIGQTFGSGTVRGIVRGHGLQSVAVPANPADTLGALFAGLNATAFVDLRGLKHDSALYTYFQGQHSVEEIGALIDPSHPSSPVPMVIPNSFDGLVYVPVSTAATNGVSYTQMKRNVSGSDETWTISGGGFDDVTASTNGNSAIVRNEDGLNATLNALARRFDASPYVGKSVRVTGQARIDDLLGFALPVVLAQTSDGSVLARSQGSMFATSGSEWAPFTITLNVPQNAATIEAGITVEGFGTAEVRDVQVSGAATTQATNQGI